MTHIDTYSTIHGYYYVHTEALNTYCHTDRKAHTNCTAIQYTDIIDKQLYSIYHI